MSSTESALEKRFDDVEDRINKLRDTLKKLDEKIHVKDFDTELEKRTYYACLKAGLKRYHHFHLFCLSQLNNLS